MDTSTRAHISMGVSYLGASTSAGKGEYPRLIQRGINVWPFWEGRAPARPQTARLWTRAQRIATLPSRPLMGRGEIDRMEVRRHALGAARVRRVPGHPDARERVPPWYSRWEGRVVGMPSEWGQKKLPKNQNLHLTVGGCEYCKICVDVLGKKANDARVGAVRSLHASSSRTETH